MHRYYYVNKLIIKESLHMQCAAEQELLKIGETGAKRLSIFENITELSENQDCKERNSSQCSDGSF